MNYLLQRMEASHGLAILATNMKSALDKVFPRRLRFIVEFPFPDAEQRKVIWHKVFLARLDLVGGSIHNTELGQHIA